MKYINYLFVLLSLSVYSVVNGQSNEVKKKYSDAEFHVASNNYALALPLYLEVFTSDPSNANLNYKIGICYLKSVSEKNKAVPFLELAVTKMSKGYDDIDLDEKDAPYSALYHLGRAYHFDYKFDEAISFLEKYKVLFKSGRDKEIIKELDLEIQQCVFGKETVKKPNDVTVANLGDSINSKYPDFAPIISADESMIIFTSRREGSTGSDGPGLDGTYPEDIYASYNNDGIWSKAVQIGSNINTPENDASVGLSADGQQLLIYKDDNGDGNIYKSDLNGDVWSVPAKMTSDINTNSWEPSACLTPDGLTLYFVSDRKGGFGGSDIWRCVKLPNGNWSLALNLGPVINTEYDEDGPFVHPNGVTMFFSSKGHKSMGGFDILKTFKDEETGAWSPPINLGFPINTTDDDVFYVVSVDGRRSYYSSAKEGGFGEKDIYMITSSESVAEPISLFKGFVTLNGGTDNLPNVRLTVVDNESQSELPAVKMNSITGKYILLLKPGRSGKSYTASYEADGFTPQSLVVRVEPGTSYQDIGKEIKLKTINFVNLKPGTVALLGTVTDKEMKAPVKKAVVIVKDNKTGTLIQNYPVDVNGQYYIIAQMGQDLNITYEAEGYLFYSNNINIPKDATYTEIKKDVELERIRIGSKIVLRNIFFDANKATLRKESKTELQNLYDIMKKYPEFRFEISGHTDSKGNDAVNLKLSQSRSQSVEAYLIKKGIPKDRMLAKGYGETTPMTPNLFPNGKPDKNGMQLNRRVEFKIID